ncbi:MAG: homoaconitate hydratase [Candidatus Acididesulfobacter diazotrophicus]|jgi:homocitrate synthase NifV|uniref:Homoaconitate hydratase n=1 Tax=Candidatus Acididesulfobacter diazotrophicus TaxID=2597226 RepID=A0A519BKX8_9DELT|nr:MAG: homoaconitate hydratase [Candidatus Acididesulfobacter diazotrophicus]
MIKLNNKKNCNFLINDTTLRDGEQTAGVIFSYNEKILIAKMLDEIGVNEIEAGIPIMGGEEKNAIKTISSSGLNAKIISWNRANIEDIKASLDIGVQYIHISIPISDIHIRYKLNKDFDYIKNTLIDVCRVLRKEQVVFSIGGEDSSRADKNILYEIINIAEGEGAYKYRYSDTVGILNPLDIYKNIKFIKSKFKQIAIEIHAHNDLGMATGNSVAALKAGADYVSGSITGIGERTGNCALEEVIAYFKFIEKKNIDFDFKKVKKLASIIAKITKRPIPVNKPILGRNIFHHEAGIHTDGIIKNPINYEPYPPEEVGLKRKLLIGKHSGTSVIKYKLKKLGIIISDAESRALLEIIRQESIKLKRDLKNKEIKDIYHKLVL